MTGIQLNRNSRAGLQQEEVDLEPACVRQKLPADSKTANPEERWNEPLETYVAENTWSEDQESCMIVGHRPS